MSEKKLEKAVELDASPDVVWEAISTGPGISAWFVPTEITGRTIRQDFGSGNVATGQVTAYEPGSRFAYGAAEPEQGRGPAFEFLVQARDGGGTVLRFVQSGFGEAEGWEAVTGRGRSGFQPEGRVVFSPKDWDPSAQGTAQRRPGAATT